MARRAPSSGSTVCLYLLAIFVGCGADFWINLCLFVLGWIPGVIHAWWVISRNERPAGTVHGQAQPIYRNTGPKY